MKKLLGYIPFHFLCFVVLGIFLQYNYQIWGFGPKNLLIVTLFLILTLFFLLRKKGFEFITYIVCTFIGILITFNNNDKNHTEYYENYLQNDSYKTLIVTKVLKPGNYYTKYEAEVVIIDSLSTLGKVLLNVKKDSLQKSLQVGQYIHTKINFRELIPPLNPHQFDYKSYLSKQGIHRQVFLENHQFIAEDKFNNSLFRIAFLVRTKIQKSLLNHNFSGNEFAVMNALLLGQRQDISKELINDYAKAGAIHILAVSGLHVGIILLILNLIFRPVDNFKYGKLMKAFLIVFLLWCFALVAGLSASVVRAVTMFSAVAIGQLFQRKNTVEYSLVISMLILLLVKPMFLFDVGFQLSYLAVFGIIWVQPKLYQLWKPTWKIVDFYWQLITVSVAAQFGILPISLFYFHQFPGLFILSNLVIIPFLGIILAGGILMILLSLLNVLPEFLVNVYSKIISLMNQFIQWISNQESWLFTQISFSEFLMIASYGVIIFCFQFFLKRNAIRLIYFLFSIVLIQAVFWIEKWDRNSKTEFIVFHKSRYSVFGERNRTQIKIYHDLDSLKINNEKLLVSYKVGVQTKMIYSNTIPLYFEVKNQPILIINKSGIYKHLNIKKPVIVLQNSPKINLQRVIKELNPSYIIANGSNYKSYIQNWEKTSLKTKTPFWYTGQKGAYIIR